MPLAKDLFLERMRALESSVGNEALTNRSLTEAVHNNVAKMLRNGLAVVGFAALEDFIKLRTSEVLGAIGTTGVPFSELPERLRIATTYEALNALSYQLSLRPKSDRIMYAQEHAQKLASTATSAYELTPHAFGYSQANIQPDALKEILQCFVVSDPWRQMTQLASRLGLAALPLDETFRSAALRRHRAAHVAHADTPQSDLIQYVREAFAIAISFDALLTHALNRIKQHDKNYLTGRTSVEAKHISIRSVKCDGPKWKEWVEGRKRAVKIEADLSVLIASSRLRALAGKELFVQFDGDGVVSNWESH